MPESYVTAKCRRPYGLQLMTISLSAMDIIQSCLALAPVPYLSTAFSIFKVIWVSVEQVQASNKQLQALSYSIAQLLEALDRGYRQDKLQHTGTSTQLEDLHKYVPHNRLTCCCIYACSVKTPARDCPICQETIVGQLCEAFVYQG